MDLHSFNSFKLDSIMGHIGLLVMAYNIKTNRRLRLMEQQHLVELLLELHQRLPKQH